MKIKSDIINFKDRFILAMAFIAIIFGSVILTNYAAIQKDKLFLEAIERSDQQRIFSQRIALLSNRLLSELSQDEYDKVMNAYRIATKQMAINHYALGHGNQELGIPDPPENVAEFYFDPQTNLNQSVGNFLQTADKFYDALHENDDQSHAYELNKSLYNMAFHSLLNDLDHAVKIYRESRNESISSINSLEPVLLIFSILCLTAIWFFVFGPLNTQLIGSIERLKKEKDESETQKRRYDLAVQGTSTGIWDWDIETGKFYWNSVLKYILGLPDDANNIFTTDYFQTLLHPNDRDLFNAGITRHIKSKSDFYFEGRVCHAQGHYLWVCFRGQALWDLSGRAYRMVGSIEDVTEKREAEMQKNIFIQGIESSGIPFAILETHNGNRFSYATQTFCALSGHSAHNLLGKNLNIFTGPETSMSDLNSIDYAIKQKQGIKLKILSYRMDGSSFWNHLIAEPIPNRYDNNKVYFAIIFNDMTESILREKMEIQRQRNESLGALAASVAHEINNLLMPMTMAKDVLENELKEDCDPFAREQIDTIVDYATQAKEIVNGVLIFARKETKDLEDSVIYDLLKTSVSFIGGLLNANTSIIIEEPDDANVTTLKCLVNPIEFRQLITNLAKNSEHAFNGNKGLISISLSSAILSNTERKHMNVQGARYIIIHFKDNGIGIPKHIISRIFDPLFTTRDVGSGTGLGLSIVHGILQSWGGAITVDSTEGVGTKFNIYIPITNNDNNFDYLIDLLNDA